MDLVGQWPGYGRTRLHGGEPLGPCFLLRPYRFRTLGPHRCPRTGSPLRRTSRGEPVSPFGAHSQVPDIPPQNRGCAVVAVIGATLVVIVLAALGGWYVLSRDISESGELEAAHGVTHMANSVLDDIIPHDTLETEWRSRHATST